MRPSALARVVLPLLGLAAVLLVWTVLSQTVAPDIPSPARTWQESRRYVLEPARLATQSARTSRAHPIPGIPGCGQVLGAPRGLWP